MIKLFDCLNNLSVIGNFNVNRTRKFRVFSHHCNTFSSVKCFTFDNTEDSLTKGILNDAGQCGLKSDIKDLKDLLLAVKNEISDLKAEKCNMQITGKNQGK